LSGGDLAAQFACIDRARRHQLAGLLVVQFKPEPRDQPIETAIVGVENFDQGGKSLGAL